ncbi:MAG: sulfite exporter TauE/SafE family protein [Salinibacter sp.]
MNWILAGLAFGVLGSVHCVGMCGPLALSLPGADRLPGRFLLDRLLYNAGRVVTYALLGGLVGLAGRVVSLAGFQQVLSIGIGAAMVLVAVVPWVGRQVRRLEQPPSALLRRVTTPMSALYRSGGPAAMLLIGLLNGLLPCGFVYAALATAVTAGDPLASMAFMAAFGLGTGPAMLGVSLLGRLASTTWRTRLQRWMPVGLAAVGLLLIVRGLALGGMLSPLLPGAGLVTPHA